MRNILSQISWKKYYTTIAAIILMAISLVAYRYMPQMMPSYVYGSYIIREIYTYVILYTILFGHAIVRGQKINNFALSFTIVYLIQLASQLISNLAFGRNWGIEQLAASFLIGMTTAALLDKKFIPKTCMRNEVYIEMGIICLATKIFCSTGDLMTDVRCFAQVIASVSVCVILSTLVGRIVCRDRKLRKLATHTVYSTSVIFTAVIAKVLKTNNRRLLIVALLYSIISPVEMVAIRELLQLFTIPTDISNAWLATCTSSHAGWCKLPESLGSVARSQIALSVKSAQYAICLIVAAAIPTIKYLSQNRQKNGDKTQPADTAAASDACPSSRVPGALWSIVTSTSLSSQVKSHRLPASTSSSRSKYSRSPFSTRTTWFFSGSGKIFRQTMLQPAISVRARSARPVRKTEDTSNLKPHFIISETSSLPKRAGSATGDPSAISA